LNNDFDWIYKEALLASSMYSCRLPEGLRKTVRNLNEDSRYDSRDSNQALPE
jgi:hypothetical protein